MAGDLLSENDGYHKTCRDMRHVVVVSKTKIEAPNASTPKLEDEAPYNSKTKPVILNLK